MKINWNKKTNWVGAFFAVTAFLIFTYLIGKSIGLNETSWPGWVQAIGSFAAIFGAFLIANSQHVNEKILEKQRRSAEDIRKVKIVKALFDSVGHITNRLVGEFDATKEEAILSINLDYFSDFKNAMSRLPLFEMPDHRVVVDITIVLRNLEDFTLSCAIGRKFILASDEPQYDDNPYFDDELKDAINYAAKKFYDLNDSVNSAVRLCEVIIDKSS